MLTPNNDYAIRFKPAFTLIEMLVAMAVLAILGAVLIPVTLSTLERSRSARSVSNMKQIGLTATVFSQDQDGSIPAGWDGVKKRSWMQQLQAYDLAYQESQDYMFCPLMVNRDGSENTTKVTSYAMNNNIGDREGKKAWEGINTIYQCTNPTDTALLFNSFYHSSGTSWKFTATSNPSSNIVIPADGESVYVLFLDGSVRAIPATDGRLPGGTDEVDADKRKLFWNGR